MMTRRSTRRRLCCVGRGAWPLTVELLPAVEHVAMPVQALPPTQARHPMQARPPP